mmetsp:Transcript_40/g.128  ORF Transcript_40/g.128 Transcript_40/m.128 type:complete len:482 (-) Transcript_40:275-1720(-)
MRITKKRKAEIIDAYNMLKDEFPLDSPPELLRKLRQKTGAVDLRSTQQVTRWKTQGPSKRVGRKFQGEFEVAVLNQMVYTKIETLTTGEQAAVVIANVCYSHATIRMSAQIVQQLPQFAQDKSVQAMKLSNSWIHGFLQRNAMRPRRITAQAKTLPPPADVQAVMEEIQQLIDTKGFSLAEVFNGDETGMLFGAAPKLQYVPLTADRATSPEGDEKARFTSFLYGSADGEMGPTFNIIKCQSKNPYDLSGTTVVGKLLKIDFFSAAKGWTLMMWSRKLVLPMGKKNELKEVECKRPYLLNSLTGDIITCQNKAWMDSAGIAMWCDLQFGPRAKAATGKALMVWDNCGPHKVASVRKVFEEWGVTVKELPPKMTDILQPMDLITNAPLKSAIRRARVAGLFSYFQNWKVARLQAERDKTPLPPFSPPKPTLADGLQSLLECVASTLNTDKFKSSMRRTFVKVGLAKQESNAFVKYTAHKKVA